MSMSGKNNCYYIKTIMGMQFKNKDEIREENYRLVSVLGTGSDIFKRVLLKQTINIHLVLYQISFAVTEDGLVKCLCYYP